MQNSPKVRRVQTLLVFQNRVKGKSPESLVIWRKCVKSRVSSMFPLKQSVLSWILVGLPLSHYNPHITPLVQMRRHLFVHLFGDVLAQHGCTKLILAVLLSRMLYNRDKSLQVDEGVKPMLKGVHSLQTLLSCLGMASPFRRHLGRSILSMSIPRPQGLQGP